MPLSVVSELGDLPAAQRGYFTRAQAAAAGIDDFELTRSVDRGLVERLDHGVYRVSGAGHDDHQALRVAWFRLAPNLGPRERIRNPTLWVSHESAAVLHGFGVYLADTPTFTSKDRLQSRAIVKIHRRSAGFHRSEYTGVDGFVVTTIERTAADLARLKSDGGHVGRFIDEAVRAQATTVERVARAMDVQLEEVEALRAMATEAPER
jgi:predicted transcriptional regulator of viral defense system